MDLQALLSDPNFQSQLGRSGQIIGNGGSVAEALNPAQSIDNTQTQTATANLIQQLLGGKQQPQQGTQTSGAPTTNVQPWQPPKPTAIGQAGPDSVATKTTADGTTHTVSEPSPQNLASFGKTTPPESQSLAQNGGSSVPFLQALLQQ